MSLLVVDGGMENVFFTSRDRLVVADRDEGIDLYDARVGGGFSSESEPAPCQGEGCQPLQPAALEPSPASATLNDPGNVGPAKKCKKGQVKKKGKCKRKPSARKKRGRQFDLGARKSWSK